MTSLPSDPPRPLQDVLAGWPVFVGFVVLFWGTRAQWLTADALTYLHAVTERDPWSIPHHLAYLPTLRWCWEALEWLGVGPGLLAVAQVHNVLFAAWGAVAFGELVARVLDVRLRLVGALSFGVAMGVWTYASIIEPYVPATTLMIVMLNTMLREPRQEDGVRRIPVGRLSVVFALAVLYHQSAVLITGLFLPKVLGLRGRDAARVCLQAGGAVIVCYLMAMSVMKVPLVEFWSYVTSYAHLDNPRWGTLDNVSPFGLATFLDGQVRSIVHLDAVRGSKTATALGVAFGLAVVLAWLVVPRAESQTVHGARPRILGRLLLVWVVPFYSFNLWWLPIESDYAVFTIPPVLLVMLFLAREASARVGVRGLGFRVCAGIAVCGLAVSNYVSAVAVRARDVGPEARVAASMASGAEDAATIFVVEHRLRMALMWHEQINLVRLVDALHVSGVDSASLDAIGAREIRVDTRILDNVSRKASGLDPLSDADARGLVRDLFGVRPGADGVAEARAYRVVRVGPAEFLVIDATRYVPTDIEVLTSALVQREG